MSGALLLAIGQDVRMTGTLIKGASFAVNIRNGCNGLEAMVIFIAAVIAFPASSLTRRALGTILGILFIYAINLLRVVGLYLTGRYLPQFFDDRGLAGAPATALSTPRPTIRRPAAPATSRCRSAGAARRASPFPVGSFPPALPPPLKP